MRLYRIGVMKPKHIKIQCECHGEEHTIDIKKIPLKVASSRMGMEKNLTSEQARSNINKRWDAYRKNKKHV